MIISIIMNGLEGLSTRTRGETTDEHIRAAIQGCDAFDDDGHGEGEGKEIQGAAAGQGETRG